MLRRLVEAGTRIVQLGYAQGGGDVEDIVNAAQAEVYAVADKRGGEDYHAIGDIIEATVDEIEVASGRSGEMTGVPTGFTDFDALTNGLHPGQMIVIAARPAMGKALALDTPLPTPAGWTTMGEVAVGDFVIGADGRPTRVVAATEVMVDRPCYEVEFSDGSVMVADEQHQWLTHSRAERRRQGVGVGAHHREIALSVRTTTAEARLNHSIANAGALQLREPVAACPALCPRCLARRRHECRGFDHHGGPRAGDATRGRGSRRQAPRGPDALLLVPARRARRRPDVCRLRRRVRPADFSGQDLRKVVWRSREGSRCTQCPPLVPRLRPALIRPPQVPGLSRRARNGDRAAARVSASWATSTSRRRTCARRGPASRSAGRSARHRRHRDQCRLRAVHR